MQLLLSENLSAIEDGLTLISKEARAYDQNRIDLLVQDNQDSLCVIELKHQIARREVIGQILDYAHFVSHNYEILKSKYSKLELTEDFDPDQDIRLILVADDFTDDLLRALEYVNWEFELYRYQAFEMNNQKSILCLSVKPPARPEISSDAENSIENLINYIRDQDVKKIAKKILKFIETLEGVRVGFTQDYIAFKNSSGKNFASLNPRRQYFHLYYKNTADKGLWYYITVSVDDDYDEDAKKCIIDSYKFVNRN